MKGYIIELEKGVFAAKGRSGDPARTLLSDFARVFETEEQAQKHLKKARGYRKFINAKIIKI
jgi:hypothetical protein